MKRIVVSSIITNESELLQYDAKKILAQLLEVSEENIFPFPEGKEVGINLLAEIRDASNGLIS